MNMGERNSGEVFKWVKVNEDIKASYASELTRRGLSHAPEDLLVAVNVVAEEFNLRRLLLELAICRLMKNSSFPKAVVPEISSSVLSVREYGAISIVISPDAILNYGSVEIPNNKGTILLAKHPMVNALQYQAARKMLLAETNGMLQEIGKPLFPDYGNLTNWIR